MTKFAKMNLENIANIVRETTAIPLSVEQTGEKALDEIHQAFFIKNTAKLKPAVLRDLGVYIGGFLYIYHEYQKVDYKFFQKATGGGAEYGYMFPYIASESLKREFEGEDWDFFIDSLFLAHRKNQQKYIWSISTNGSENHLVPEYISKTPFFIDSPHQDPYLLVPFSELLSVAIKYRRCLGELAGEPSTGFENEWLLWKALKDKRTYLTEYENEVLALIAEKASPWQDFFSSIKDAIATLKALYEQHESKDYSDASVTISEIGIALRQLHADSKFPILPYLYWNVIDKDLPKTHLVLPVWVDFSKKAWECLKKSSGGFEPAKTRLTGAAVISIAPKKKHDGDSLCPVNTAILLSRFISFPQIAASYYEDLQSHRTERRRAAKSAAIAAIAAQSLSHNIGSHALSDARLFDATGIADGEGLKDFHQYLQGRLDYVAQLIAKTPPQPEPLYLWRDVLAEFFRQRLLLNRLVADRSVEGRNLSFKVTFPGEDNETTVTWENIEKSLGLHGKENETNLKAPGRDVLVAIPGGSVGRHALYSIIENMIRNSVKYGGRRQQQNDLCIHFRLREPGATVAPHGVVYDFWLLEIWDNFSGFLPKDERFGQLVKNFTDDVIDKEGKTRTSGHGMIEIKEAMRFLHSHDDHKDEDEEMAPYACVPDCHRTSPVHDSEKCEAGICHYKEIHCCHANLANVFESQYGSKDEKKDGVLVYRVRLRRPRMLGVVALGCDFGTNPTENKTEGVSFCTNENLTDFTPHLLVIRDNGTSTVEELKTGVVKEIAKQHWRLPFRLFVVVTDETRRTMWREALSHWEQQVPTKPRSIPLDEFPPVFLPPNRVRLLIATELHKELATPQGHLNLAFVNRVYDHWLMAYKPRLDFNVYEEADRWHLATVFERDEVTVRHNWSAADEFTRRPLNSLTATAYLKRPEEKITDRYGRPKPKEATVDPVVGKLDWIVNANSVKRMVHFGNHGASPPGDKRVVEEAMKNNQIGFSQAFGSSEGPRTFNMLYAPPKDSDGFAFFCLTVVEAALTRVAVFDERVAGVFFSEKESAQGKLFSKSRIFYGALGLLFPLFTAGSQNAPSSHVVASIDWAEMKIGMDTHKPEEKSIKCLRPMLYENDSLQFSALEEADVVVLHEGLVEELVGNGGFQKGADLCLFSKAPHVVRTSGKGRDARQLGVFLPFCEYSAISAALAPLVKSDSGPVEECLRFEKIALARSILNTIGTLPRKNNQS